MIGDCQLKNSAKGARSWNGDNRNIESILYTILYCVCTLQGAEQGTRADVYDQCITSADVYAGAAGLLRRRLLFVQGAPRFTRFQVRRPCRATFSHVRRAIAGGDSGSLGVALRHTRGEAASVRLCD